ncbi:hypothetical protein LXL04_019406 [Taraxacum kok-saghyz]
MNPVTLKSPTIGPESSVLTHTISYLVKELQIPLLSLTATDPTLSSLQYPFFIQTTHSDLFQMAAIADIIDCTNRGLDILDVAQDLGMMESGYVWIATDWISTIIDITSPVPTQTIAAIQGVITLRSYIKDSEPKRKFITKWENMTNLVLSAYSLYAYDTIWLLALALDDFFNQGGNISFSKGLAIQNSQGRFLNLDALSVLKGGKILLENILKVKMNGTTGPIDFTFEKNLIFPAFEVINVMGTGLTRTVGYWSNSSRLSTLPPETLNTNLSNQSSTSELLQNVIFPGKTVKKPRGWAFHGKELKIGVPTRVSFQDLVEEEVKEADMYVAYSVDMFISALKLLPYSVPYKIYTFGDGVNNPSYTDLVSLVNDGVYDAAVGDISIVTNRTWFADFTQPFIESGLVVVARVSRLSSGTWDFFRPFTAELWAVIGIFFLVVGAVVWILEHRQNDEFRGAPRQQFVTTLWFSFSTLFFSHRIDSLKSSKDRIGYQDNSFVKNYLVDEIGISEDRLFPLVLPEDYEKALNDGPENGGVVAIVDERPYIELFLSTRCQFSIVGQDFTRNGWGFAFQRDSPLAIDMSNAILKLSETGELQNIHKKWLKESACSSQGAGSSMDRLELRRFKGLFLIIGLACFLALFVYLVLIVYRYTKHKPDHSDQSPGATPGRLQTFISFIDEKEDSVNSRSKKRLRQASPFRSNREIVSSKEYRSTQKESSLIELECSQHGD